jgi:hypothetical protein
MMKNHAKAFIASALTLAFVGSAAAQVRVGIYASTTQPYYPEVLEARPQYVIPNGYYLEGEEIYVEPSWQERREWRERRACDARSGCGGTSGEENSGEENSGAMNLGVTNTGVMSRIGMIGMREIDDCTVPNANESVCRIRVDADPTCGNGQDRAARQLSACPVRKKR